MTCIDQTYPSSRSIGFKKGNNIGKLKGSQNASTLVDVHNIIAEFIPNLDYNLQHHFHFWLAIDVNSLCLYRLTLMSTRRYILQAYPGYLYETFY